MAISPAHYFCQGEREVQTTHRRAEDRNDYASGDFAGEA